MILSKGIASIFTSRNMVYLLAASNHDDKLSIYVWTENTFKKMQAIQNNNLEEMYDQDNVGIKLSKSFPNEILSLPMIY